MPAPAAHVPAVPPGPEVPLAQSIARSASTPGTGAVPAPVRRRRSRRPFAALKPGRALRRRAGAGGMATAEYAIATLAACGFAGLLLALLRSGEVRSLLFGIVRRALSVG